VFPHQEPRFLIPLTVPVVLLGSTGLRGRSGSWRPLLWLWYAFNILLTVIFGMVHQGGVMPAVRQLGTSLELKAGTTEATMVFSKTYSPPGFLLLRPESTALRRDFIHHNRARVRLLLEDLQGRELYEVRDRLLSLAARAKSLEGTKGVEVFIALPSHLGPNLQRECFGVGLTVNRVSSHFPHVSTEEMPPSLMPLALIDVIAEALNQPTIVDSLKVPFFTLMRATNDASLAVYKVELPEDAQTVAYKKNTPK